MCFKKICQKLKLLAHLALKYWKKCRHSRHQFFSFYWDLDTEFNAMLIWINRKGWEKLKKSHSNSMFVSMFNISFMLTFHFDVG